jgi:hypothetical protein
MSYRVVQAPGCAVLRPDYDALFATEAKAQALLESWTVKYPNVYWAIEDCESIVYPSGKPPPLPVNAEWVNGHVRRIPLDFPTRTPRERPRQPEVCIAAGVEEGAATHTRPVEST